VNPTLRALSERQKNLMWLSYAVYSVLAVANLLAAWLVTPVRLYVPGLLPLSENPISAVTASLAMGILCLALLGLFVPFVLKLALDPKRARPLRPRFRRFWLDAVLQVGKGGSSTSATTGFLEWPPLRVNLALVNDRQLAYGFRFFWGYSLAWASGPATGLLGTLLRLAGADAQLALFVATLGVLQLVWWRPDPARLHQELPRLAEEAA